MLKVFCGIRVFNLTSEKHVLSARVPSSGHYSRMPESKGWRFCAGMLVATTIEKYNPVQTVIKQSSVMKAPLPTYQSFHRPSYKTILYTFTEIIYYLQLKSDSIQTGMSKCVIKNVEEIFCKITNCRRIIRQKWKLLFLHLYMHCVDKICFWKWQERSKTLSGKCWQSNGNFILLDPIKCSLKKGKVQHKVSTHIKGGYFWGRLLQSFCFETYGTI